MLCIRAGNRPFHWTDGCLPDHCVLISIRLICRNDLLRIILKLVNAPFHSLNLRLECIIRWASIVTTLHVHTFKRRLKPSFSAQPFRSTLIECNTPVIYVTVEHYRLILIIIILLLSFGRIIHLSRWTENPGSVGTSFTLSIVFHAVNWCLALEH